MYCMYVCISMMEILLDFMRKLHFLDFHLFAYAL